MEPRTIYLSPCGAPLACLCKVEMDQDGIIHLPDLNECAFVRSVHRAPIKRAVEILEQGKH